MPLQTLLDKRNTQFQRQIEQEVKFANITIIEGNNATEYGIGMVSARITEAILKNEQAVFPVGSYNEKYSMTLSLPSVVGEHGVTRVFEPALHQKRMKHCNNPPIYLKKRLQLSIIKLFKTGQA